jgi:hypothetical protein
MGDGSLRSSSVRELGSDQLGTPPYPFRPTQCECCICWMACSILEGMVFCCTNPARMHMDMTMCCRSWVRAGTV